MLDLTTLVTLSGVLAALLAVSIRYAMDVATPSSRQSLRVWQIALAFNAAYWFLFLVASTWAPGFLPEAVAIVLINAMSICSTLGYVTAFRLFMRMSARRAILVSMVAASVTGNLVLGVWLELYWGRLVFNLLLTSSMMLWLAYSLFRCQEFGVVKAARMSMWVFVIASLAIFSILYDMMHNAGPQAGPAIGRGIALFAYAMVPCFGTLGFLLMHVGRASHHLEHLAATDPLTGACNRRSLETAGRRMLSAARREGKSVSVLMIDADRFKTINDQHGHEAGDLALVSMMNTLSDTLRGEDVIGRIGGEEFVVLLPNTDARGALDVAERVRQAMQSQLIDAQRLPFSVTISVGVSTTYSGNETLDELIHQADSGLYEAKAQGRNRVIHRTAVRPRLNPVA